MYIVLGLILALPLTVGSYWWFSFDKISPWYSFFLILIYITWVIIYFNIYWAWLIIHTHKYKNRQYVGKVSLFNLSHIRSLAAFLVVLQGLIIKKKGFENIPKEPSLILFNHISDYDPWVLYKLIKGRYAMVGKKDLLKIKVIGALASSVGTLYVGDKEDNITMIDMATSYIKEKETSVVIAPEGTRNFTGELKPFKHGGFNIAIRSQCPIVLVGFTNMQDALKKHRKKILKIQVEVFDIIKPEEYMNMSAKEVAELCENKYKSYLGQL